ncbi:MAG: hypothetical protein PHY82_01035 [Lentisphaeria bacterium]|nr:hypothetical protein [Lentisphaeria bacterium]
MLKTGKTTVPLEESLACFVHPITKGRIRMHQQQDQGVQRLTKRFQRHAVLLSHDPVVSRLIPKMRVVYQ